LFTKKWGFFRLCYPELYPSECYIFDQTNDPRVGDTIITGFKLISKPDGILNMKRLIKLSFKVNRKFMKNSKLKNVFLKHCTQYAVGKKFLIKYKLFKEFIYLFKAF